MKHVIFGFIVSLFAVYGQAQGVDTNIHLEDGTIVDCSHINQWHCWRWNPVWEKLEEESIWLSQVERGTVTDNYAPQLYVLVGFVAFAGKWH